MATMAKVGGMLAAATAATYSVMRCTAPAVRADAALDALSLRELRKRAEQEGVDSEALDDALDSENPTQATVKLILAKGGQGADATRGGAQALQVELGGMRLAALHKRALAEGIAADALENAMDADDPKAAMIAAIVGAASRRGPADRLLSALAAGGETSADALSSASALARRR